MVLDSWAVMAWLKDQKPAADIVDAYLRESLAGRLRLSISILSLGEVYYLTAKHKDASAAGYALESLKSHRVAVVAAPNDTVLQAARVKARWPISYADAFAVVTALNSGAKLVTGDAELKPLGPGEGLALEWIG